MIDIIELSPSESIVLDTTNNTISIVLLTDSVDVSIVNQNSVEYAKLQSIYEIYTLAINTGVYTATNNGTTSAKILIVREFIY